MDGFSGFDVVSGGKFVTRGTALFCQGPWGPLGVRASPKQELPESNLDFECGILQWLAQSKDMQQKCERDDLEVMHHSPDCTMQQAFAGDVTVEMHGDPQDLIEQLSAFLQQQVATDISIVEELSVRHLWALIFLDYVPLQIQVSLFTLPGRVVAVFRDARRTDVLLFHRLVADAIEFLVMAGTQVSGGLVDQAGCRPAAVVDDDLDEFADDLYTEQDWFAVAEPLVDTICSNSATLRDEAIRVLARVAQKEQNSRESVATALLQREEAVIEMLFQDVDLKSVSELYPIARVLMTLVSSPEAAAILTGSKLAASLENVIQGIPQVSDLLLRRTL